MRNVMRAARAIGLGCVLGAGAAASHAQELTGRDFERRFGPEVFTQVVATGFGNNTFPDRDLANGSELDNLRYNWSTDGVLTLAFGGSLETNFNKFNVFVDFKPGGQNRLRGDNPNVAFDGLNRMGDDGTGNGLTFDPGMEPDLFLSYTIGGSPSSTSSTPPSC